MIKLKSLIVESQWDEADVKKAANSKDYTVGPLFHGTVIGDKSFNNFRVSKRGALYFTDNKEHAEIYKKETGQGTTSFGKNSKIYKVYLKANFFDLRDSKTKQFLKSVIKKCYEWQLQKEKENGMMPGTEYSLFGMSGTDNPTHYIPQELTDEYEHEWAWRDPDYRRYDDSNKVKVIDSVYQAIDESSWSIIELWAFRNGGKWLSLREWIQNKGYTGFIQIENRGFEGKIHSGTGIVYAVFNPNQVKSAELITYDDDGVPIPLEKRFDDSTDDIRF